MAGFHKKVHRGGGGENKPRRIIRYIRQGKMDTKYSRKKEK